MVHDHGYLRRVEHLPAAHVLDRVDSQSARAVLAHREVYIGDYYVASVRILA